MKKIIALLITVLMVLALAGCGKSNDKPDNSNAKTEQKAESKDEQKSESKDEQKSESKDEQKSDSKNDSVSSDEWPAEKIAEMAAKVHATVPELKMENLYYEETDFLENTLYISADNITKEDYTEWLAALAEQGFVRSLGFVSNSLSR